MAHDEQRPGEVRTSVDPAKADGDAGLIFIGRADTPWSDRGQCPHNLREARERGGVFKIRIDQPWHAGLKDLAAGDPIVVLYWMDKASRNLIIQAPRHSSATRGVFSLRSPVRPNPIALAAVRISDLDYESGCIRVDALDCVDGTPILDIKPWIESIDVPQSR